MSPSQFVCIDGAAVRLAWKRDRLCATVAWWELDENSRDSHWSCRARTDDVLVVDSNGAPTKFPPGSSLEPLLFDAVHHTASGAPLPTALLRLRRTTEGAEMLLGILCVAAPGGDQTIENHRLIVLETFESPDATVGLGTRETSARCDALMLLEGPRVILRSPGATGRSSFVKAPEDAGSDLDQAYADEMLRASRFHIAQYASDSDGQARRWVVQEVRGPQATWLHPPLAVVEAREAPRLTVRARAPPQDPHDPAVDAGADRPWHWVSLALSAEAVSAPTLAFEAAASPHSGELPPDLAARARCVLELGPDGSAPSARGSTPTTVFVGLEGDESAPARLCALCGGVVVGERQLPAAPATLSALYLVGDSDRLPCRAVAVRFDRARGAEGADASAEDSSLQLFLADASGLLPIIATFHGIADGGIVAGDFRRDGSQQLMIVPAFGDSGEEAIASPAPVAERAALFSAALTDGRTLCWKGRRRDVGAAVDLAAAARRGHDVAKDKLRPSKKRARKAAAAMAANGETTAREEADDGGADAAKRPKPPTKNGAHVPSEPAEDRTAACLQQVAHALRVRVGEDTACLSSAAATARDKRALLERGGALLHALAEIEVSGEPSEKAVAACGDFAGEELRPLFDDARGERSADRDLGAPRAADSGAFPVDDFVGVTGLRQSFCAVSRELSVAAELVNRSLSHAATRVRLLLSHRAPTPATVAAATTGGEPCDDLDAEAAAAAAPGARMLASRGGQVTELLPQSCARVTARAQLSLHMIAPCSTWVEVDVHVAAHTPRLRVEHVGVVRVPCEAMSGLRAVPRPLSAEPPTPRGDDAGIFARTLWVSAPRVELTPPLSLHRRRRRARRLAFARADCRARERRRYGAFTRSIYAQRALARARECAARRRAQRAKRSVCPRERRTARREWGRGAG